MMMKDDIYANPLDQVLDFEFDEKVVNVFPNMIKRSVPGYTTLLAQIPSFAQTYAQTKTRCYDLGCSLGATTLMLQQGITAPHCSIIAVDNSAAMIHTCRKILHRSQPAEATTTTQLIQQDIETLTISNASIVTLNFTLQFIPLERRHQIIQNIYAGLNPGGILILSEKIHFPEQAHHQWMTKRHRLFKTQNGYSDLEISQKRNALDTVLVTESMDDHLQRLKAAGFSSLYPWYQCFNFTSIFASKPS